MTHVSSSALNRRGTACALEAESDWRTSKRSRRSHRRSVPASLSRAKIVLQSAGVEFIDENGGGPGGVSKKRSERREKNNSVAVSDLDLIGAAEFAEQTQLLLEGLHALRG